MFMIDAKSMFNELHTKFIPAAERANGLIEVRVRFGDVTLVDISSRVEVSGATDI